MDKRALAIIIALLVAVPAAFCMAQGESEADFPGTTHDNPVNLGSLTLNVGETKDIDIRNNEAAYADYNSYKMEFEVQKDGDSYQNIVTFTKDSGDVSSASGSNKDDPVGGVTVGVTRSSEGMFILSLTGNSIISATNLYIRCTVSVTEAGNTVEDEIFYKVGVTVIGADGTLEFTSENGTINATSGVNVTSDNVVTATAKDNKGTVSFDTETVYAYAYGLPAGLNLSASAESNGSVTITVTGMTTEVSTDPINGTSVYVVVRNSDGVEYGGTFYVKVAAEKSIDYDYVITGATPTTVTDSYYVINDTSDESNVLLKITGKGQPFQGAVYVISHEDNSSTLTRTPLTTTSSGNESVYDIPVDGVGTYVIEILNVDGSVQQITLNVVPQSVGAGAGLIINGN